jgi:cell division initiation protein
MEFSGLDIQLKEFNKSIRGYNVDEVKDFLDDVSKCYESLSFENKVLKDKLREKELTIMDFKEREATLKDTMVTAQRVTENIKKDATRESLHIITQAKMKADTIIREARQSLKQIMDEINQLKKSRFEIASRVKATLQTHLNMIENYEKGEEITKTYNISHETFPKQAIKETRLDLS